jgi:hypothetical protein
VTRVRVLAIVAVVNGVLALVALGWLNRERLAARVALATSQRTDPGGWGSYHSEGARVISPRNEQERG